jgi:hypothetical protein
MVPVLDRRRGDDILFPRPVCPSPCTEIFFFSTREKGQEGKMPLGATSGAAAKRKRPFQKISASVPAKKSGASTRVVSSDDDDDDDEIVPDSSPPSPIRESVNKGKGNGSGKVGNKKVVAKESPVKRRQAGDDSSTSSPRSKSPKKKEAETPGKASAFGTSCSKGANKKPSSAAPAGEMVSVPSPPPTEIPC